MRASRSPYSGIPLITGCHYLPMKISPISYCLTLSLTLFFGVALEQVTLGQDVGVRNTSSTRTDELITVKYDLVGEEETYQVTLLVSASGGKSFDYEPQAVFGDVGDEIEPGSGKEIKWRYQKDFPDGLQKEIRYRIKVQEKGGNGWLYALGSAVVVGGGATAAAFLTGVIGGGDGGGYPSPPGPPGN